MTQQGAAKNKGKLAGYTDAEISRSIQFARLTYKLKNNPSPTDLKNAGDAILKVNGIFGRALARHRAGKQYKRQLRLEAALERTKAKRTEQEGKAKKPTVRKSKPKSNPVKQKAFSVYLENSAGKGKTVTIKATTKDIALSKAAKENKGYKAVKASHSLLKTNRGGSKSFEAFHGRPSTKILLLETPEGAPKNKAYVLGLLLEIRLKGKPTIDFRKETTGRHYFLIADEGNKQMWIAAEKQLPIATPNPDIPKGKSLPYAEMTNVIYEALKVHLGDTAPQGYIHKLGWERTGNILNAFRTGNGRPQLAFDRDGCGIIVGGSYTITPLGIAD